MNAFGVENIVTHIANVSIAIIEMNFKIRDRKLLDLHLIETKMHLSLKLQRENHCHPKKGNICVVVIVKDRVVLKNIVNVIKLVFHVMKYATVLVVRTKGTIIHLIQTLPSLSQNVSELVPVEFYKLILLHQ